MGRVQRAPGEGYKDRIIDIDILLFGDLKMQTPSLTIPHPLMDSRDFVQKPLSEILP
jgi:2-amino-4-hydroxy-6-hydroxymethyldihydropteridine diphosphokinase